MAAVKRFPHYRQKQVFWLLFAEIPGWDEEERDDYEYSTGSDLIARMPIALKEKNERDYYVTLSYVLQHKALLSAVFEIFKEANQHNRYKFYLCGSFAGNKHIVDTFGAQRAIPTNNIDFVFDFTDDMKHRARGELPANGYLTDEDLDGPNQHELRDFAPYDEARDGCWSRIQFVKQSLVRSLQLVFPSLQKKFDNFFLELIDINVETMSNHTLKSRGQSLHIGFNVLEPQTDTLFAWHFVNVYMDCKSASMGISQLENTEVVNYKFANDSEVRVLKPIPYRKDLQTEYDRRKVTRRQLIGSYFDYAYDRKMRKLGADKDENIDDYIEFLKDMDQYQVGVDVIFESSENEEQVTQIHDYDGPYPESTVSVNEEENSEEINGEEVQDETETETEPETVSVGSAADEANEANDDNESYLSWNSIKSASIRVLNKVQELIQNSIGEQDKDSSK
mmetsp:Transcript_3937/g.4538  ORF Transcript_3937/g.4538 Transcript_3937/m.4538 type:complete len:450 (+) Transcript_3937:60-1409(+)